jgi:hypothetical protein
MMGTEYRLGVALKAFGERRGWAWLIRLGWCIKDKAMREYVWKK